jgi:large subunit ribosomal protein L7/L12
MAEKREEILEGILQLPVLDVAWLVKELEEKFGVSAAAPVAVAVAPAAAAPAEAAVEEKTEFTALLQDIGANKVNVIKAVREVTTLGLREAKELVEAAPKAVKEAITREEADDIKKKLEAAGAKVAVE